MEPPWISKDIVHNPEDPLTPSPGDPSDWSILLRARFVAVSSLKRRTYILQKAISHNSLQNRSTSTISRALLFIRVWFPTLFSSLKQLPPAITGPWQLFSWIVRLSPYHVDGRISQLVVRTTAPHHIRGELFSNSSFHPGPARSFNSLSLIYLFSSGSRNISCLYFRRACPFICSRSLMGFGILAWSTRKVNLEAIIQPFQ